LEQFVCSPSLLERARLLLSMDQFLAGKCARSAASKRNLAKDSKDTEAQTSPAQHQDRLAHDIAHLHVLAKVVLLLPGAITNPAILFKLFAG
jgi:hypothetical protein